MIKAGNLIKNYDGFSLNVDFDLQSGRVTGFVGKNGAGKSTVIKLILGLINPDGGNITLLGKTPKDLSKKEKEKIGVALAESGFSPYLRGSDIMHILKKSYPEFNENRFLEGCKKMRLPMDKPLKDFSTGMKAKMRVLVAITHNAKILVMDEPTAGLDVEARNEVLDMIRAYMTEDETRAVLITSHISSDLEGICDDIYLIDNGKILLHEDTDVILEEYGILKVDEKVYGVLDKDYILKSVKTSYGYLSLTRERRYYQDNYPEIVIEKGSIDELILILAGGDENESAV